jgi:hypothetical protein
VNSFESELPEHVGITILRMNGQHAELHDFITLYTTGPSGADGLVFLTFNMPGSLVSTPDLNTIHKIGEPNQFGELPLRIEPAQPTSEPADPDNDFKHARARVSTSIFSIQFGACGQ